MSTFAYSERNDMDWNYDEIAEKLEMQRVDIDEKAIPFVLEEARKRNDGDVIYGLADWFEAKDDTKRYLELCMSMNTESDCTRPCLTGCETLALALAFGAEPIPASLE